MPQIRPLSDRVFIKRIEAEEKTAAGLYIPDAAQEKGQTGKVIALGNNKDFQIKVGDVVFFGKYAGTDFDSEHVILKEEDILGVVEK